MHLVRGNNTDHVFHGRVEHWIDKISWKCDAICFHFRRMADVSYFRNSYLLRCDRTDNSTEIVDSWVKPLNCLEICDVDGEPLVDAHGKPFQQETDQAG